MAQQLRACTVLTQDPNLHLSTHTGGLITACNPSSRRSEDLYAYIPAQIYMPIIKYKIQPFLSKAIQVKSCPKDTQSL